METIKKKIEQALAYESKGDFKSALSSFNKALKDHTDDKLNILFDMSLFLLRSGHYADALGLMIQCHKGNYRNDEIVNIAIEVYYAPNIEEFANRYHENTSILKKYNRCNISHFPTFEELKCKFIPFSEKKYCILNKKSFNTIIDSSNQTLNIALDSKQIYMMKDEYNITNIAAVEKQTRRNNNGSFATTQMPIFCIYENKEIFIEYLQIAPLGPLLETGRIIFLFGLEETIDYFNTEIVVYPNLFINMKKHDSYYEAIEEAKLSMLKKDSISYQNLMQIFNVSFDT